MNFDSLGSKSPDVLRFTDITALDDSGSMVVCGRNRKRSISVTIKCDQVENTAGILDSLNTVSATELSSLSGRQLKQGIGSKHMRIIKVEDYPEDDVTIESDDESCKMSTSIESRRGSLTESQDGDNDLYVMPITSYLQKLQEEIRMSEKTLKGYSLKSRIKGTEKFTRLRKDLASQLFRSAVRPKVESLISDFGLTSPFDDAVAVAGYNRLFTRTKASLGTDVDFMLVIDTDNFELLGKIRLFIQRELAPTLKEAGIVIETDDYLMTNLETCKTKLDDTRVSLFTLANMFNPLKETDNVVLLTGSERMLRENIFRFSDQQLVLHYQNLLRGHGFNAALTPDMLTDKKDRIVDHLQRMANSEIYLGKNPYKNKQTIQTEMASKGLKDERRSRVRPFPIKSCISRIGDIIHSTTIEPQNYDRWFTEEKVNAIEALGTLLSNIVCYQMTHHEAPVTAHSHYTEISLEQIQNMTFKDRSIVCDLLDVLGIDIEPCSDQFGVVCYDGLWSLADRLHLFAITLEKKIFEEAAAEVSQQTASSIF